MGEAVEYKVWVQVERISGPEGDEEYDDIGLPDCLGIFGTEEEACAFVRSLPGWEGRVAETSDYRKGRFQVREGEGFPSLDVFEAGQKIGVINCLAVEDRVKARREETGDPTLMVTESDIEWALENASVGKEE